MSHQPEHELNPISLNPAASEVPWQTLWDWLIGPPGDDQLLERHPEDTRHLKENDELRGGKEGGGK